MKNFGQIIFSVLAFFALYGAASAEELADGEWFLRAGNHNSDNYSLFIREEKINILDFMAGRHEDLQPGKTTSSLWLTHLLKNTPEISDAVVYLRTGLSEPDVFINGRQLQRINLTDSAWYFPVPETGWRRQNRISLRVQPSPNRDFMPEPVLVITSRSELDRLHNALVRVPARVIEKEGEMFTLDGPVFMRLIEPQEVPDLGALQIAYPFARERYRVIRIPHKPWQLQDYAGPDYAGMMVYEVFLKYEQIRSNEELVISPAVIDGPDITYLNGKLLGRTGEPGKPRRAYYDRMRVYPVPQSLLDKNGFNRLTIFTFASNPGHPGTITRSGFITGYMKNLRESVVRKETLPLAMAVVYVIISFYFLVIFIFSRNDIEYMMLFLLLNNTAIYILFRSQLKYFFFSDFLLLKRLEYIALILFAPLIMSFVYYYFPDRGRRFDIVGAIIYRLYIVFSLCALCVPLMSSDYDTWAAFHNPYVMASWLVPLGYMFSVLFRETYHYIHRTELSSYDAMFLVLSFVMVLFAGVYDIKGIYGFVYGITWLSLSVFALMLVVVSLTFLRTMRMNRDMVLLTRGLERAYRVQDDFLQNLSSELKKPLESISDSAGRLMSKGVIIGQGQKRNLDLIKFSARRLLGIVQDMIDFAELNREKIVLELGAVDPASVVDSVLQMNAVAIRNSGLEVRADIQGAPLVLADYNRTFQILQNLVSNALKFTSHGGVTISINRQAEYLEIHVVDTGVGIPEERQGVIFNEFTQADGSIARRYGGTGLGLSISRRLVELHGGQMSVHSIEGSGSDFWFSLPLFGSPNAALIRDGHNYSAVDFNNTPVNAPDEYALPAPDKVEGHIYVLSSDPVTSQMLVNWLSLSGQIVSVCDTYSLLFEKISTNIPDAVIIYSALDPDMAVDCVADIRRTCSLPVLPILVLGGYYDALHLQHAFAAGVNDIMFRPFDRKVLVERIMLLVNMRRMVQRQTDVNSLSAEITAAFALYKGLLQEPADELGGMNVRLMQYPDNVFGGNFYYYRKISDQQAFLCIMDIQGEGLAAVLVAAMLRVILHELEKYHTQPVEVLSRMIKMFAERKPGCHHVTAAALCVENGGQNVLVARAGYIPFYVYRKDAEAIETVMPKGASFDLQRKHAIIEPQQIELQKGDVLCMFSNGLFSLRDATGHIRGEEWLKKEFLRAMKNSETGSLNYPGDAIREAVVGHDVDDDILAVFMERVCD